MPELLKKCPQCGELRPSAEAYCEGRRGDQACGYLLTDEPVHEPPIVAHAAPPASARNCANGHPLEPGDLLCLTCGAEAAQEAAPPPAATDINGWAVAKRVAQPMTSGDHFEVTKGEVTAVLTVYPQDSEPDTAVQEVLKKIDPDHTPHLRETGRYENHAYEVWEKIDGAALASSTIFKAPSTESVRWIADELGRALRDFAELGLRHREISPHSVLLRSEEPLDLVITSFGSARLSDYDLEAVSPLQLTRYSAPEAIVGGVSVASDWWSLGVILLEHVTKGACFEGINDKAFQIHVVTRGITVPRDLDPAARALLRGLLTRDPLKRWKWAEVHDWLEGKYPAESTEQDAAPKTTGPSITLGGRTFRDPGMLALAAAETGNWEPAKGLLLNGTIATWLASSAFDERAVAQLRTLVGDESLDDDLKLSLSLMHLSKNLPFIIAGEIVSPAWLLKNPDRGFEIVCGPAARHLVTMEREKWLTRLTTRFATVQERAKALDIRLDESRLRSVALSTSRANLEAERALQRQLFPDAANDGLASLAQHDRLTDEELILLVAADHSQLIPLDEIVQQAQQLAQKASVSTFAQEAARTLVQSSRRDIYKAIDERISGFARCSIPAIDEWADTFRIERRIALPRAAVLLSVPKAAWQEPPRQRYVSTLLQHFRKKVEQSIQQGPLVRFAIGKSSSKVDLTELGTSLRPANALLEQVLRRGDGRVSIDPDVFLKEGLLPRIRRMLSHAQTFRRDTGIDGRYLGFPFVVYRPDAAEGEQRAARIAPVLLWPVVIDLPSGRTANATIAFDKSREEVRLNPALGALVGSAEVAKWARARNDVLARTSLRIPEVMDLLGGIAAASGRELGPVPSKDTKVKPGELRLVCSAALFNAEFTGQAIGEDLKNLENIPPAGTALEAALRLTTAKSDLVKQIPPVEERFHVVEADPSQEAAVYQARQKPGLLIEGPPGTGKSQTIVNIVADAIAKGETALVVCQKQVALQVVQKRLAAEGLEARIVSVTDPARDREAVVKDIREQVEVILRDGRAGTGASPATLRASRRDIARACAALETELNAHHQSLHAADDVSGFSYRNVLAALLNVANAGGAVPLPGIRPLLAKTGMGSLENLESECSLVASLWLRAKYEDSPLHVLNAFAADEGTVHALKRELVDFTIKEAHRKSANSKSAVAVQITDPDQFRAWIVDNRDRLSEMSDEDRRRLSRWLDLFKAADASRSTAEEAEHEAHAALEALGDVTPASGSNDILKTLEALPDPELMRLLDAGKRATAAASFWGRLSWARFRARSNINKWLRDHQQVALGLVGITELLAHETALRPVRNRLRASAKAVKWSPSPSLTTASDLAAFAALLAKSVRSVLPDAKAVLKCPARPEAEQMVAGANKAAYSNFEAAYDAALLQHAAREASRVALAPLTKWFSQAWTTKAEAQIAKGKSIEGLQEILDRLDVLPAFQQFRARSAGLTPETLAVLKELRPHDSKLEALDEEELIALVQRTIRREALTAWKGRLEMARPELLANRTEIEGKAKRLADAEGSLREKNRELLQKDIDFGALGTLTDWTGITRLRGERMRRLREVFDEGRPLGLMKVRPVWLMTPDVVSRLLPLSAKLFDVVIFDEASQLLVEHAVPALFRAARAVVSGDEKQMPPTSFFSSRGGDDEDETDLADIDDFSTEQEREVLDESWNRKEIKDCPDLLALANACFPSTTLQIHYRSKYRELIAFSNSAFYKGALSVPAKHPTKEVQRVRPIQVFRVDGCYEAQTNEAEAKRVVDGLVAMWKTPQRPSSCVVTFNKKQADLINELIEERASEDSAFLEAFEQERARQQNGEDMQFFVKNVENVQGDERDVVIFSTTFGRNPQGSFRRNFGALGQKGGERRLNVAVTRARIRVVLVTSMPVNDISDMLSSARPPKIPRDYLQGYLDYATKVSAGQLEMAELLATRLEGSAGSSRTAAGEDAFVAIVSNYIKELGVSATLGRPGDTFGLDLAIESADSGHFVLGIECDAPKDSAGHLMTARSRDVWRPKILRRAVPVIHRVSSHGWYHDNAAEKKRLQVAVHKALSGTTT